MKKIKFSKTFLTSKVAQRIFLLFLLCIVFPIIIVSYFTYNSVSSELFEQAQKKLIRTAKNKGFEIYNNLNCLDREIKIISERLKKNSLLKIKNKRPSNIDGIPDGYYLGIILLAKNKQITNISNTIMNVPEFTERESKHMSEGKSLVKIWPTGRTFPSVFMCQQIDIDQISPVLLIAEINPVYLWNIGSYNTLPPEIEFMVYHAKNKFLISSLHDIRMSEKNLQTIEKKASGTFSCNYHKKEYISSFWSLFIKPRFLTLNWIMIASQSESTISAPISNFRKNFFNYILLSFLIVSLLSLILIRKSLVPIETLQLGTKKIASGNFNIDLKIKSGDEFEMLGKSFNEMSKKLKEGQKLLVQAAKMSAFGQISAGIVHEIGQPLTSISGLTQLLLLEKPSKKQKARIQIIQKELGRLGQIIHKFSSFSYSTDDIMASISINEVIDEVYDLFEHQTHVKGISFQLKKEENLPLIRADKDSLKQVFINLVINAMDALESTLEQQPFIDISTSRKEKFIHVDVEDNGIGIPKENHLKIFNPFFTTKSAEKGSGLGLAIIDSIIHKHKAFIEMKSKVGKGTCFTISFPI
ncbi:MAG: HAMP domain-containing protein [Candidatus Aminicenantes bacterium]|nr:HAMP domain-containing protein [Candidatus Aminicenantes bacterium]